MTEQHPTNARLVAATTVADTDRRVAELADQRPDGPRAAQSPANTGEQPGSAWPGMSQRLTGPAPQVVPSGVVPMNPNPGHPERTGAAVVSVAVAHLDLPGSGPVVSRPAFGTAPINAAEADRG